MTRIIAGLAGGRTIAVPSSGTRPTSDRVREAIFSRVESWADLTGSRVLDLFAGSGALGLEAASRGATRVDLVDNSDKAVAAMTANITTLRPTIPACEMRAHRVSVAAYLESATAEWDIAFIDPPYAFEAWPTLLGLVNVGLVVAESDDPIEAPDGWTQLRSRRYGRTWVTVLEH